MLCLEKSTLNNCGRKEESKERRKKGKKKGRKAGRKEKREGGKKGEIESTLAPGECRLLP